MPTGDWKPLTVVATAAASLCRRRVVLNCPFAGGPSWQGMEEEGGGENMGGLGREKQDNEGWGRESDREEGEFLTQVDFQKDGTEKSFKGTFAHMLGKGHHLMA